MIPVHINQGKHIIHGTATATRKFSPPIATGTQTRNSRTAANPVTFPTDYVLRSGRVTNELPIIKKRKIKIYLSVAFSDLRRYQNPRKYTVVH